MALSVASGAFNTNTVTGNQTITGLGFQPQFVLFWGGRNATGLGTAVSYATFKGMATGAANRGATFGQITDQATSAITGAVEGIVTNRCYQEATDNGGAGPSTITLALDFVSNNADGFTVNVVTADATSRRVFYLALGGLTNAVVGNYQTPATTTGNQTITGLGFQPDLLMVLSYGGPLSSSPAQSDTEEIFGFAKSASVTATSDIEPTQVTSSGWDTTDTVLETNDLVRAPNLGATRMQHKLVSMDAGGFTINRVIGNPVATDFVYGALKGLQVAIGSFAQPIAGGAQNQSITGLPFRPQVVLFQSEMAAASASPIDHFQDGATAGHMTGVALSSTNRRVHATAKRSARGAANVIHRASESLILTMLTVNQANPSTATLNAEADFVSMDAGGFTIRWNSIDATARNVVYLALAGLPAPARARIFGVPLPYRSEHRRDASVCFRSLPQVPVQPRPAFLTTPEMKRPTGEGSVVFPAASLITAQPPVVPAFLTTPEAFRQPSRLQVSIIRGAGTLPAPVSPPPVVAFLTTHAANRETLKDASIFFKPIFLQYDPLGGGAFFATVVPWRDRNLADASILFAPRQPAILDFPEIRRFHAVPFMEPPRREGSVIFLPPGLFASVASLIEIKNRWVETPVPWRYWPGARHDASWVTVYPQPPQVQPPPSPRAGNVAPQWLRRRRLLFGI